MVGVYGAGGRYLAGGIIRYVGVGVGRLGYKKC